MADIINFRNDNYAVTSKKIAKTNLEVRTITLESTRNALLSRKRKDIEEIDYDDMKAFTKKKMTFQKGKTYQINVFTELGWRSGELFRYNGDDSLIWYSGGTYETHINSVEEVYAIQIIKY